MREPTAMPPVTAEAGATDLRGNFQFAEITFPNWLGID